MSSWAKLPSELLCEVYKYLNLEKETEQVQLHLKAPLLKVCKAWHFGFMPSFYREISITSLDNLSKMLFYRNVRQDYFGYTHFLQLAPTNPTQGSLQSLMDILSRCIGQLEKLHLVSVDLSGLDDITMSNLNDLSLSSCLFNPSFILNICNNLNTLALDNCPQINEDLLYQITEKSPNLTTLSVSGCFFKSLYFLENVNDLKILDLSHTAISIDTLSGLVSVCHHLTDLSISGLPYYSREAQVLSTIISSKKNLVNIDGRYCPGFFPSLLQMDSKFLAQIVKLGLGYNAFLTESSSRLLFQKLDSLQTLVFAEKAVVTDLVLHHVTSRSNKLLRLTLPHQPMDRSLSLVNPHAILKIPTALPNLIYFEAQGYLISDDVLLAFATTCPNLETFNICNAQSISPHLTVKGIEGLLQACLKLKHLLFKNVFDQSKQKQLKKIQQSYSRVLLSY